MNDINSLQELFTSGVINLLTDLLLLAGVIIILFTLSPELTIAIMVTLPIMFFISTSLRKKYAAPGKRCDLSNRSSILI